MSQGGLFIQDHAVICVLENGGNFSAIALAQESRSKLFVTSSLCSCGLLRVNSEYSPADL
jgi:hypothetical protein